LLDRYLEGEEIDLDVVEADLLTAVARGRFHPVIPVSTETGVGTLELLHLLTAAFPPPTLHPLPAATTPDGDPCRRSSAILTDPLWPKSSVRQAIRTSAGSVSCACSAAH
ncbi:MAG TPA: elongation factor G-like protein EF-G2, partial [Dermatophilaceae bacterium]|nr:elongation factor G-like protein EF-G2 [Dermatophilaceae bacterium]